MSQRKKSKPSYVSVSWLGHRDERVKNMREAREVLARYAGLTSSRRRRRGTPIIGKFSKPVVEDHFGPVKWIAAKWRFAGEPASKYQGKIVVVWKMPRELDPAVRAASLLSRRALLEAARHGRELGESDED